METILNLLINATFTNAAMFHEYAVPSGVISCTGSTKQCSLGERVFTDAARAGAYV
jgi:hypothetical protein